MTKIFTRVAIRWKLPAMVILLTAVAIGVMGVAAYHAARETIATAVEAEAELFQAAAALRNSLLAMGGIGLAVAISISLLISRSVAAPLDRVGEALRAVAGRDYSVTVPGTGRGDEIGDIARNIEEVRQSLIGAEAAARSLAAAEEEQKDNAAAQARVVAELQRGLGRVSEGDLTASIDEPFAPDYEQLRTDFNTALATLREAMLGVVENAHLIRGEAKEISSAADDLSARTETQAATLEQTAAALDELTASVKSAAEGAGQAAEVVASARANAEASGAVVTEAVDAMGQIESSSSQISKIISVIDDIAFQTNLLALNAGVEAARAGDAGRGFAVVASEVRALAQRSSEAAREINGLISASGGHVKRGVELVGQAGRALQSIFQSVSNISEHVAEIATSACEQSRGLAEINDAVNQLDQVTQQNVAMFEETTAASHALTREAEALTSTMARFRTGAAEVIVPEFRPAKRANPRVDQKRPAPTKAARAAAAVAVAEATAADEGWTEF